MSLTFVITTIQAPTPGVRSIAENAAIQGSDVVVIGDKKSPAAWTCDATRYFSLETQRTLHFTLVKHLPLNNYARKMLGYLIAMDSGSQWIRETDDDNSPNRDFFAPVPESVQGNLIRSTNGWVNPYAHFTHRFIWPRGYPLTLIGADHSDIKSKETYDIPAPFILQALADGDPDVDAIYRLTSPDTSEVTFINRAPLGLQEGAWCPFNSQATTWPKELFALMYLPVTCTFRMTDIWRSFVAQRLLPGLGATLVFTAATVYQDRNEHDLLADFEQEVPGYLGTERLRAELDKTEIRGGKENLFTDLWTLYQALIKAGFLTNSELPVLNAWIEDVQSLGLGI